MKKTLKQLAKLGTMLSSFHWCYSVFILKDHNDDVDNIDYDDIHDGNFELLLCYGSQTEET